MPHTDLEAAKRRAYARTGLARLGVPYEQAVQCVMVQRLLDGVSRAKPARKPSKVAA